MHLIFKLAAVKCSCAMLCKESERVAPRRGNGSSSFLLNQGRSRRFFFWFSLFRRVMEDHLFAQVQKTQSLDDASDPRRSDDESDVDEDYLGISEVR